MYEIFKNFDFYMKFLKISIFVWNFWKFRFLYEIFKNFYFWFLNFEKFRFLIFKFWKNSIFYLVLQNFDFCMKFFKISIFIWSLDFCIKFLKMLIFFTKIWIFVKISVLFKKNYYKTEIIKYFLHKQTFSKNFIFCGNL